MTNTVITSLDQVTPAWLTAVLAARGALTRGAVEAVEWDTGRGNWSSNARLRVRYSTEAQGAQPERLFLKLVQADLGDESFSDSEATYYTRDYVDVANAPLLPWYDAVYSDELKRYHLLLADVSETHVEAAQKGPTLEYGLALAEGLAALHARWWGARRLAEAGAPPHSAAHIQAFVDMAAPGVEHIVRQFAPDLQPHWPEAMRALFAHHPAALIRRAQDPNGQTLIHGDAGAGNILAPREGERPLYLIDRQPFNWSLTTWLGVYDLAYAVVLDWDTPVRRACELPMLRRYHAHLLQHGVTDYSWERLYDDYRLCAAMGVYIATEYCRGGVIADLTPVWLPMLQRALTACDDLRCSELWP